MMQSLQDLFTRQLAVTLAQERVFDDALKEMVEECRDEQVRRLLSQHEKETQQQVKNLERCFRAIGAPPVEAPCPVAESFREEHDIFLDEEPSAPLLMMFDLGAQAKIEHLEIATYRGLIEKARLAGNQEVERLLSENLRQEESMAQRIEQVIPVLGQQAARQSRGPIRKGPEPSIGANI